jgi:hypothetical protein
MPGIADKFTQSAQGRLRWPGMTSLAISANFRRNSAISRRDAAVPLSFGERRTTLRLKR